MCFTPTISISTAIIEFVTGGTIFLVFKKKPFIKFVTAFLYVLGFYQFTEFMMCTSSYPILWAKLGFVTYTFLPAIGLDMMMSVLINPFGQ